MMLTDVSSRFGSILDGHTLVTPDRRIPRRERILTAWEDAGGYVLRTSRARQLPSFPGNVSCYGSPLFCVTVADEMGAVLDAPDPRLLAHLPTQFVERAVEVRSIGSLEASEFPRFIKSLDFDLLPSRVYQSIAQLAKETAGLADETQLLISEPVNFQFEVRALVYERKVISITPYPPFAGHIPQGATEFLSALLTVVKLPSGCIVDIGYLDSGTWCVVEANPIWAADPLTSEPSKFVRCLAAAPLTRRESGESTQ